MDKIRKLLIIEPNQGRQDLYERILSEIPECECRIEVVSNNSDAFNMIEKSSHNQWECYDLVLMNGGPAYDTAMKGLDFLEEIKGKKLDLKVIMIYERAEETRHAHDETMDYNVNALERGVYAFLTGTKPNTRLIRTHSELALKLLYDQRESREILKFGGQVEKATILFADIEGFTSATGAKGSNHPVNIVIIVNRFFQEASRIIDKNGGIIDKYIGDEIMAIFPKLETEGYGTKEALDASIALRDFFENDTNINERFKRYGRQFKINMGICSNEVISGSVGSRIRKDYTVFGEGVNLASRLTGEANNGEILISEQSIERLIEEHPELLLSKEPMNGDKYDEKWIFKSKKKGYTLLKIKEPKKLKNIEEKITVFEVGQKVNC